MDLVSVGSPKSFDEMFLLYHDRIYRLLFRVVGNAPEAEDLTQETFLRLHDHFDEIEQERAYHWLYRVAINFGLKALRGRKRWYAWQQKAVEQEVFPTYQRPHEPWKSESVRKVLCTLPDKQVQLLLLHAAGLSYEELAEAVEVQRSSISQLLSRARRAFVEAFEETDEPKTS